jgi:hypothetical protein
MLFIYIERIASSLILYWATSFFIIGPHWTTSLATHDLIPYGLFPHFFPNLYVKKKKSKAIPVTGRGGL